MYSLFRDLAIIILSAKFFGLVARKCKAPQVVGEIIAGLLIGPCLLNLVQISDSISIFAEIGVVMLMFTTRPTFWFELGPDYWGYGMGCWMARPMDMAKLRSRIIRDPKPMEKLTKALCGQTEFTLGGDTYKRPKAGAPSELLAPWFQMKTISITHEEKLTEELFSRDVVDRIKTGYTFLLPYYDYFLTLPSDPEPETLK